MKSVFMALWSNASPGLHIRVLNPHIDNNGYPCLWNSEAVDQGRPTGYFGVSSFGFSGCNARGDIWAMATAGARKVLPLGFDLKVSRQMLLGKVKTPGSGE